MVAEEEEEVVVVVEVVAPLVSRLPTRAAGKNTREENVAGKPRRPASEAKRCMGREMRCSEILLEPGEGRESGDCSNAVPASSVPKKLDIDE